MLIDPETALVIGITGFVGSVATAQVFDISRKLGPEITSRDLLPCAPWEGLPLPRFTRNKELMKKLMAKG